MTLTHALVAVSEKDTQILQDWKVPALGPDHILVRVTACGLNFADLLMINGEYQETPRFPFVPGMEICGEVVETGENSDDFSVGDRIIGFCGSGGLAGLAVVEASRCQMAPESMDDATAAGFQIAYGTSHLALTRRARLQKGETLAVLGAAGGVGLTAVEIGKAIGARVIGIARGEKKRAIARGAGADITIDAETSDLRSALKEVGPIDVVYDAVGGEMGEAALRSLAPQGRFLVIGFASGKVPQLKANHLLVKNIDVIGYYWGGYLTFAPETLKQSLREAIDWHDQSLLSPHISHVLPFAEVEAGLDLLRTRKATGKVVITL